ncbi:hypothetical protein DIPPA_12117 [Diplonema papillatum]|nr:hypothetical protein DIPPA_12117 [Diplonema papillatum]|eukprot:gene6068-9324_t
MVASPVEGRAHGTDAHHPPRGERRKPRPVLISPFPPPSAPSGRLGQCQAAALPLEGDRRALRERCLLAEVTLGQLHAAVAELAEGGGALAEENRAVRAEARRAKAENEALRRENDELRALLLAARGGAAPFAARVSPDSAGSGSDGLQDRLARLESQLGIG